MSNIEVGRIPENCKSPYRLLVVDDEAGICNLLERFFMAEGFDVESAQDGKRALKLCKDRHFDLAFIDIMLPDIKGDALFAELLEINPDLECIIFTGYASLESAIDAVKQPQVVAYEVKPLALNSILNTVNEVLARKQAGIELRIYREHLEEMVEFRTSELSKANELLKKENLERKRYELQLKRNERQLNKLTNSLIKLQEKERSAIARELHDEFGQQMSYILVELERLRKITPEAAGTIDDLVRIVENVSGGVSRIYRGLHPALLHKLGLSSAIRTYVEEFRNREPLHIDLDIDEIGKTDIEPEVSLNIYRVLQEAMTNAARHSKAKRLSITLKTSEDCIELLVADDGKGFSCMEAESGPGVGLPGMAQRATICGGTLNIDTMIGKGTKIGMNIPK